MLKNHSVSDFLSSFSQAARWILISIIVAVLAGSASAFFLFALEFVTRWRESHVWIIAMLPFAGFLIGWVYHRFGQSVEAGNNLLIDEIHTPQNRIPLRMTPLILFGTLVTHLFGGSAGREGTAVQMGGALADQLTRLFALDPDERRILLMAGISAGFASVFGTPLAGAVFGLEVLSIGWVRYDAILPCFLSAIFADYVTSAWGIHHTVYQIPVIPDLSAAVFLSILAAGIFFGLTGRVFSGTVHSLSRLTKKGIPYAPLRSFAGGILVALAVWGLGTTRYTGLGIPVILESFTRILPFKDFLLKLIFTAVTLGFGFKGGEVTPLFFIGAALGSALGVILPLPFPVLAGVGFVAVFAGAANTPLACTLMAMEIFGHKIGIYAGIGCVMSYLFSGHAGIYHSQKLSRPKYLKPKAH